MKRHICFQNQYFSFETPKDAHYKFWGQSTREIAAFLQRDYRYTKSFILEPDMLFRGVILNYLRGVVKQEEREGRLEVRTFNAGLSKCVHKAYAFFKRYDPLFESLYDDFEEWHTEQSERKNETTEIDIFGIKNSPIYILRHIHPELYQKEILRWIIEVKCKDTYHY